MPLRHRCGYAADLPRSLPGGSCPPPREFPARHEGRVRTASSPDPPGSSWRLIKGVSHTGSSRTPLHPAHRPGPSGSTGPSRLCQGCSRPPRHHPGPAALSSTVLLPSCCDKISGEGLSPPLESQRLAAHSRPEAHRRVTDDPGGLPAEDAARDHGARQHYHDPGPVRAPIPRRDGPLRRPPR